MRLYEQETRLALIHIPLDLYSAFIQPIINLLLSPNSTETKSGVFDKQTFTGEQGQVIEDAFINISVTPIECSIACTRRTATSLFLPIQAALPPDQRASISITSDDYIVMQVDGEGTEAGQRVLGLTSPLAMAGISIFFVTTYFSDYILVPAKMKRRVIGALEVQGFAFEGNDNTTSLSHKPTTSLSSLDLGDLSMSISSLPGTPPPATVPELQARTFARLKERNVVPTIDLSLRLVQCAARRSNGGYGSTSTSSTSSALADQLNLALIKCLISTPKFISITLTDTEPASVLLEQRLLTYFEVAASNNSSQPDSLLLGSQTAMLNPIILDLRNLPLESTGIVCGVAGRLVGGTGGSKEAVEMSYLSTAKAGTVMVAEEDAQRAVDALQGWESAEAIASTSMFNFSPPPLGVEARDIPVPPRVREEF